MANCLKSVTGTWAHIWPVSPDFIVACSLGSIDSGVVDVRQDDCSDTQRLQQPRVSRQRCVCIRASQLCRCRPITHADDHFLTSQDIFIQAAVSNSRHLHSGRIPSVKAVFIPYFGKPLPVRTASATSSQRDEGNGKLGSP